MAEISHNELANSAASEERQDGKTERIAMPAASIQETILQSTSQTRFLSETNAAASRPSDDQSSADVTHLSASGQSNKKQKQYRQAAPRRRKSASEYFKRKLSHLYAGHYTGIIMARIHAPILRLWPRLADKPPYGEADLKGKKPIPKDTAASDAPTPTEVQNNAMRENARRRKELLQWRHVLVLGWISLIGVTIAIIVFFSSSALRSEHRINLDTLPSAQETYDRLQKQTSELRPSLKPGPALSSKANVRSGILIAAVPKVGLEQPAAKAVGIPQGLSHARKILVPKIEANADILVQPRWHSALRSQIDPAQLHRRALSHQSEHRLQQTHVTFLTQRTGRDHHTKPRLLHAVDSHVDALIPTAHVDPGFGAATEKLLDRLP